MCYSRRTKRTCSSSVGAGAIATRTNLTTTGGGSNLVFDATDKSFINIVWTASGSLAGFDGGKDGQILYLWSNATGVGYTISNENANANAEDRIVTGTAGTITMSNEGGATLIYNGIISRWAVLSFNA